MFGRSVLLCLLIAVPARGQVESVAKGPPRIEIPDEVRPSSDYVAIVPDTDARLVEYIGQSGLDAVPSEYLADKRMFFLYVRGVPEGTYKFTAVATLNDVARRKSFVVIVGKPGPPTPPPNPPPDPAIDPLLATLKAVYASDVGTTDKAKKMEILAGVFANMASSEVINNPELTSLKALSNVAAAARRLAGVSDRDLISVRQIIANEFGGKVGGDPSAPLDAMTRRKVQEQYIRFSKVLSLVTK